MLGTLPVESIYTETNIMVYKYTVHLLDAWHLPVESIYTETSILVHKYTVHLLDAWHFASRINIY